MRCLIIEDNKVAQTALKHLVASLDFLELAGICDNVVTTANILAKEKIDLLLLDIELPKVSGLEFLRSMKEHPLVILVTSRPEYAVDAFDYNVVDFLLKPVKEERFLRAIHRARDIFDNQSRIEETAKDYFFIREKGSSVKLVIADILYIQALGDYVTIHTATKKHTIHYSISAIEKKLPESQFLRVHRSYIIALDKIDSVEDGTAFVYQQPVPVGDTQRPELLRRLNQL